MGTTRRFSNLVCGLARCIAYAWEPLRKKRAEIHPGSRRRCIGPLKEAGYTSAIVTAEPDPTRPLQSGGVHIHPHRTERTNAHAAVLSAKTRSQSGSRGKPSAASQRKPPMQSFKAGNLA